MLIGLVIPTCSIAQVIPATDNSAQSGKSEASSSGSSAQEAYARGPEHKTSNHEAEGWISGTILDQSGAVSAGASVHLVLGDQEFVRDLQT